MFTDTDVIQQYVNEAVLAMEERIAVEVGAHIRQVASAPALSVSAAAVVAVEDDSIDVVFDADIAGDISSIGSFGSPEVGDRGLVLHVPPSGAYFLGMHGGGGVGAGSGFLRGSVDNKVTAPTSLTSAGGASWVLRRNAGGYIDADQHLGSYAFGGSTTGGLFGDFTGGLRGYAEGDWSATSRGTRVSVTTTPVGATTASEAARFTSSGALIVGDIPDLKGPARGRGFANGLHNPFAVVSVATSVFSPDFLYGQDPFNLGIPTFTQSDVGKIVSAPGYIQPGTKIDGVSADGMQAGLSKPILANADPLSVRVGTWPVVPDSYKLRSTGDFVGHGAYLDAGPEPAEPDPFLTVARFTAIDHWFDRAPNSQAGTEVPGPRAIHQTEGTIMFGPNFVQRDVPGGPFINNSLTYTGVPGQFIAPGGGITGITDSSLYLADQGMELSFYGTQSHWANKVLMARDGGTVRVGEQTDFFSGNQVQRFEGNPTITDGIEATLGRWNAFVANKPGQAGGGRVGRAIGFFAGQGSAGLSTTVVATKDSRVVNAVDPATGNPVPAFSLADEGSAMAFTFPVYGAGSTYGVNDLVARSGNLYRSSASGNTGNTPIDFWDDSVTYTQGQFATELVTVPFVGDVNHLYESTHPGTNLNHPTTDTAWWTDRGGAWWTNVGRVPNRRFIAYVNGPSQVTLSAPNPTNFQVQMNWGGRNLVPYGGAAWSYDVEYNDGDVVQHNVLTPGDGFKQGQTFVAQPALLGSNIDREPSVLMWWPGRTYALGEQVTQRIHPVDGAAEGVVRIFTSQSAGAFGHKPRGLWDANTTYTGPNLNQGTPGQYATALVSGVMHLFESTNPLPNKNHPTTNTAWWTDQGGAWWADAGPAWWENVSNAPRAAGLMIGSPIVMSGSAIQGVDATHLINPTSPIVRIRAATAVTLAQPCFDSANVIPGAVYTIFNAGTQPITLAGGGGAHKPPGDLDVVIGSHEAVTYRFEEGLFGGWFQLGGSHGGSSSTNALTLDGVLHTVTGSVGGYGSRSFGDFPGSLTFDHAAGTDISPEGLGEGDRGQQLMWRGYNPAYGFVAGYAPLASLGVRAEQSLSTFGATGGRMELRTSSNVWLQYNPATVYAVGNLVDFGPTTTYQGFDGVSTELLDGTQPLIVSDTTGMPPGGDVVTVSDGLNIGCIAYESTDATHLFNCRRIGTPVTLYTGVSILSRRDTYQYKGPSVVYIGFDNLSSTLLTGTQPLVVSGHTNNFPTSGTLDFVVDGVSAGVATWNGKDVDGGGNPRLLNCTNVSGDVNLRSFITVISARAAGKQPGSSAEWWEYVGAANVTGVPQTRIAIDNLGYTTIERGLRLEHTSVIRGQPTNSIGTPLHIIHNEILNYTGAFGNGPRSSTPYHSPWFEGLGFPMVMQGPRALFTMEGTTEFHTSANQGGVTYFQLFNVQKNKPGFACKLPSAAQINNSPQICADGATVGLMTALGVDSPDLPAPIVGLTTWMSKNPGISGFAEDPYFTAINGGFLDFSAGMSTGMWNCPVVVGNVDLGFRVDQFISEIYRADRDGFTPRVRNHIGMYVQPLNAADDNWGIITNSPIQGYDVSWVHDHPPFASVGGGSGAFMGIVPSTTFVLDFGGATLGTTLGRFLHWGPVVQLMQSASPYGLATMLHHNATYSNNAGVAANLGPVYDLLSTPVFTAKTQAITAPDMNSVLLRPTFSTLTGGTLAVPSHTAVQLGAVINAGVTMTGRTGIYIEDATVSGILTQNVGIYIEPLTSGTQNWGIITNAPIQGYDVAVAVRDTPPFGAVGGGGGAFLGILPTTAFVLNWSTGGGTTIGRFLRFGAQVNLLQSANPLGLATMLQHDATYQNNEFIACDLGPVYDLHSTPIFKADVQTVAIPAVTAIFMNPKFTIASGGTLLGATHTAIDLELQIDAGASLTGRTGIYIGDPSGTGAMLYNVGLDIAALGFGSLANIGIRNRSRTELGSSGQCVIDEAGNITTSGTITGTISAPVSSSNTIRIDGVRNQITVDPFDAFGVVGGLGPFMRLDLDPGVTTPTNKVIATYAFGGAVNGSGLIKTVGGMRARSSETFGSTAFGSFLEFLVASASPNSVNRVVGGWGPGGSFFVGTDTTAAGFTVTVGGLGNFKNGLVVKAPSLGGLVQQLTTPVASGAQPTEDTYQGKVTFASGATQAIVTVPCPVGTTYMIEARVVAHRTDGATNDGLGEIVLATVKGGAPPSLIGNVATFGSPPTALAVGNSFLAMSQKSNTWVQATNYVTIGISGNNAVVNLTGVAGATIVWTATVRVYSAST